MTEVEEQTLREENIQLRQEAHSYRSLHARSVAKIQDLEGMISALKEKVAELTRRLFGRKSEKRGQDQAAGTLAESKKKRSRGQAQGSRGHGRKQHANLPEQSRVVKWLGEEPVCAQCGLPYRHNGTVRSHQEIVWEVRLYKRVVRRQRSEKAGSCPKPGWPEHVTAPAPPRLIPRGLLSIESMVESLLRKFDSWMPLERIVRQWRELGVKISPGTWCGIWQRLVPLLLPLAEALRTVAQQAGQWLMDETRWEVFVEMEGKGSHRWWLWVVVSPRVKLYILSESRGSGVPKEFFGPDAQSRQCQSQGSLMVDRYVSYKFLADLLRLAFCWAHVRRDFVEAQAGAAADQVSWAQEWMERIGELYQHNEKRLELGRSLKEPAWPAPFVRMDPERMAGADYQQAPQALEEAIGAMKQQWEGELAQQTLPIRRRKILESLQLARRVCEHLNWVNEGGQLKAMSCRVAMLRMERAGLFGLPKPTHRNSNGRARASDLQIRRPEGILSELAQGREGLRLEWVQTKAGAGWYQAIMEQYHYLGCKPLAGAQLRYLIWSGSWLVGGLGLGASAWSVAARHQWIGWTPNQRAQRLHWIVNNNRFLLLPWMQGRNVASRILGRVARQLPTDWQNRYGYRPVLLETFVEQERFSGRCYQAANWLCVGQTKGRGKLEKHHRPIVPIKRIFLYPLTANFRDLLCR